MNTADRLNAILKRIAENKQTDTDIQVLRQLLTANDSQSLKQLSKYNINISTSKEIDINDRTYITWDDEAIQSLIQVVDASQEKKSNPDFFRTIEACNNRQSLEQYFEDILPKLQRQSSLEIRQNIFHTGRLFNYVAQLSDFELKSGMRGEAFFIFSEFSSMQIKILQQYSDQCLQLTKTTVNSSTIGKIIYNFMFTANLCFAIAIVDELDEKTRTAVQTTNPFNKRTDLLWYQVPVVYELEQNQLHYYKQSPNLFERIISGGVWDNLRKVLQQYLMPSSQVDKLAISSELTPDLH